MFTYGYFFYIDEIIAEEHMIFDDISKFQEK